MIEYLTYFGSSFLEECSSAQRNDVLYLVIIFIIILQSFLFLSPFCCKSLKEWILGERTNEEYSEDLFGSQIEFLFNNETVSVLSSIWFISAFLDVMSEKHVLFVRLLDISNYQYPV